jgi:hypothetical protein
MFDVSYMYQIVRIKFAFLLTFILYLSKRYENTCTHAPAVNSLFCTGAESYY